MASELGAILAVTVTGVPGATDAMSLGSNSTVQPVGALELIVTPVIGADPVLVSTTWKSLAVPALAVVERTWSGVESVSVYVPVTGIARSRLASLPAPLTATLIGYVAAAASAGAFAVTVIVPVLPAATVSVVACAWPDGLAS